MTDLVDFLLARIAEDEEVARAPYQPAWPGRWTSTRVLAECEAKRRIVQAEMLREVGPASHYISPEIHARISARTATTVLRLLALPYADHPDYRDEWKP